MTHKEILEQTKAELDRLVSEAKQKLDELYRTKLEVGKWYKDTEEGSRLLVYITDIKSNRILGYGFGFSGAWLPPNTIFYSGNIQNAYTFLVEATHQEVEEALVREAERRGFLTRGTFFKSFTDSYKIREVQPYKCYDGKMNPIKLSFNGVFLYYGEGLKTSDDLCSNPRVFENGKWAETIEQPVDKFAELKEAHKNGAIIECLQSDGKWFEIEGPQWQAECEYRIKPEAKTTLDQDIQELKDKHQNLRFTITIEYNL